MENLFIDILEITLPISAWIALLLLCSPLLKRSYVAKWRYFMWLFVAARLVLPFRLRSPITMKIPSEVSSEIYVMSNTANTEASAPSLSQILTVLWIIGMAAFAIYQIISYISFKRLVKRWSKDISDNRILNAFESAKAVVGVKRRVNIRYCKAVTTPMIFGMINPVLLLPYVDFTDDELPIILRHELVHLRRHDIWYKLLLIAARTIHWFNPLSYLMVRAANKDMELACDAEVIKCESSAFRKHYCEAIMRLVHNGRGNKTALSTCFFFSKKTVMERFKNIVDEKIKRNGVIMFCVVAVSIAVSGGIISFATEQVAEIAEDNLQIIERPVETPIPTAESPTTTDNSNTYEERSNRQSVDTAEDMPVYSNADVQQENTYTSIRQESMYIDDADQMPAEEADDEAVPAIEQGADKDSVYEQLGEPDSVSGNGNKEIYTLSDGSTAVVQYDEGVLDAGYILVD